MIDFADLGKIVYAQSSGFLSREDVVRKIKDCEETPDAIRKLKEDLQSNYTKFFKTHFSDNKFQEKWEKLQVYRNKIAHNNLFVQRDQDDFEKLADDILSIIEKASEEIPTIEIKEDEREAIQKSLVQKGLEFDFVTAETFLTELEQAESYYNKPGSYVGLNWFVKDHLGSKGYDYAVSYTIADELIETRRVERYVIERSLEGYSIPAIRLTKNRQRT